MAAGSTSDDVGATAVHNSTISLREIFSNINPSDGEFLKYVPDEFLDGEQKAAKMAAQAKEQRKIDRLKF